MESPSQAEYDAGKQLLDTFPFVWGVYDGQGEAWVGNSSGPLVYREEILAKAAATIITECMVTTGGRFRAKLFTDEPLRLKDEVEYRISIEEAMQRIEGRCPSPPVVTPNGDRTERG